MLKIVWIVCIKNVWWDVMDIEELLNKIDSTNLSIPFGRIKNISTTTLTAVGLEVAVGDIVKLNLYSIYILF